MVYDEFNELNKKYSGALSRESFLMKTYPEFYTQLIQHSEINRLHDITFKELIYSYLLNDASFKNCVCGKKLKFYTMERGYSKYCSTKCSNSNTVNLIKSLKFERYGDSNYNNKEKFKETVKNNYALNISTIIEKRKKTKKERYGNEYYHNPEKAGKTKKNTTLLNINEKLKTTDVRAIDILDNSSYIIYCSKCNKESNVLNSRLNLRLRNNLDPCVICNNYNSGKSQTENTIGDYIESLGLKIIRNDRKSLDGMEIDILLPDHNIGFEYNGLYWHSEINTAKDYHINKQEIAKESGISLINIWEDDWKHKSDIIKSKIKHLLKLTDEVIYARKCKIKNVDFKAAKNFLNDNHLQGFCPFSIAYGLYVNDDLVSICTFGKRKISGSATNELLRFTNKINHHVPGGFTKLMKHYIKENSPCELITFADRSWSPIKETIYIKNGFEFLYSTKPNYWYIIDKVRSNRFNHRKSVLVDLGYDNKLTEREIMFNRGIYRIYDCGQYKYKLII
jgi:hypothetical protein